MAELDTLKARTADVDLDRIRREFRRHIADVRGVLGRHVPQTRQILRKLLVGPLPCEAFEDGDRVGYRFIGHGTYAALVPDSTLVVAPTGPNRFRLAVPLRRTVRLACSG